MDGASGIGASAVEVEFGAPADHMWDVQDYAE
jgi:hypothetical protein